MKSRKAASAGGRPFFNPFPKYLQVRHMLERRLAADYEVGQQIPTEEALCREFGVSRETVREAVRGLEADGIVQRRRPKGTFLVRRPDQPATRKLTGLVEDFTALNLDTHASLLAAGPVKPPAEAQLVDPQHEEVFRIARLRMLEGAPLAIHEAFLPLEVGRQVAKVDLARTAISEVLAKRLRVAAIEESHEIEAMVADPSLAELLQIAIGAPVLLVRRSLRLPAVGGMVLFRSFYRADRYYYTLNLGAPAGGTTAASARKRGAR